MQKASYLIKRLVVNRIHNFWDKNYHQLSYTTPKILIIEEDCCLGATCLSTKFELDRSINKPYFPTLCVAPVFQKRYKTNA